MAFAANSWQAYTMALQGQGSGGGSAAGGKGTYKPDWQCPMCAHVNFARRQVCESCQAPRMPNAPAAYAPTHAAVQQGTVAATEGSPLNRSAGMGGMGVGGRGMGMGMGMGHSPALLMPGDWCCPITTCGALNSAMNKTCQVCRVNKDYSGPQSAFSGARMGQSGGGGYGVGFGGARQYPPDWKCLACGNINFARRTECKKCNAPRTPDCPETHVGADGYGNGFGGARQYPPDWKCLACGNINFARRTECKKCNAARTPDCPATHVTADFKPDWRCTSCDNVNFAKRTECKQCAKPRTADAQPAYAPTHAALKMTKGLDGPKPGDWQCTCGYMNFARRTECGKCLIPKPPGATAITASNLSSFSTSFGASPSMF